jgi:hypothetical protein
MTSATEIIGEVMRKNGVNPKDIPKESWVLYLDPQSIRKSLRYYRVKGFAWFLNHGSCFRTWPSAHSWCVMDLKAQTIVHKYTQFCQKCEGESQPYFDENAIRSMAEYAVKSYLRRTGRLPYDFSEMRSALDDDKDDRGPHDEGRCSMCKELGHSCWK